MAKTEARKTGLSGLEIKIELMRRGIKLIDIAVQAGVKPSAVTKALNDNDHYIGYKIRPYIADALGLPIENIWPLKHRRELAQ